MSEKNKSVWQDLPDLIFGETMLLLGLEELQKCRQVCQIWNVMISQMTKNKKNTIWSKAKSLATQIGNKLVGFYIADLTEMLTLASMAHHGIPISVLNMNLHEDLTTVSVKHLASLASCVTDKVKIQDVNFDAVLILLDNINCKHVFINQTLGSEGTQSLVRAMESNVDGICLGPKIDLDIAILTKYSGKGKCFWVSYYHCNGDTRFVEEMSSWGRRMKNWETGGELPFEPNQFEGLTLFYMKMSDDWWWLLDFWRRMNTAITT